MMINGYPEGGLKMIDIASFNKSLKATWIKKISWFRKPPAQLTEIQRRIYLLPHRIEACRAAWILIVCN